MNEPARCAFYGRVSTEDNQDPTLSLPRQLSNCEEGLERIGGRLVAYFYDVESGISSFEQRGSGRGLRGFDIPIPRDGGLGDLLELASEDRFDVVVCESINRFSRNPSVTFRAEEQLREAQVKLWPVDEPWEETFGSIVLRHLNVGLAHGYVHELKIKSRQGLEAAAKQGRHVGGMPLYGYRFREMPHPNPHRAAQGRRMRILEPDPVRSRIVEMIFRDYVDGGLSLRLIVEKLNSDLHRYPPPVAPDPAKSRGYWAKSSVWDMLHNPKYTGHQIWNRKARKNGNRTNPIEAWIWSEDLAHEPLVSKELFEKAAAVGDSNGNGGRASKPQAAEAPAFALRSFLVCGVCGLRMIGHRQRSGSRYYGCNVGRRPPGLAPAGHPRTVYVSEAAALEKVLYFLNRHLFGPDRISVLAELLDEANPEGERHKEEKSRLLDELDDLSRRIRRQVANLESEEPGSPAGSALRARLHELADLKAKKERQLKTLEQEPSSRPAPEATAELLELLPITELDLQRLTEKDFRDLFEALRLKAVFRPEPRSLSLEVTLSSLLASVPQLGLGPSESTLLSSVPPTGFEPVLPP